MDRAALLEPLVEAARAAGDAILRVVAEGFEVETKDDDSPVTRADRAAERVILEALAEHCPEVPVIAEEQVEAGHCPSHDGTFFLVDPLDGTKEFVRGGDDYTVNIGLIEDGVPVLGVIHVPATGVTYAGGSGIGGWVERDGMREALGVREREDGHVAVLSKSHLNPATMAYLEENFAVMPERVSVGSSLKFCLLAEGEADFYPRLSPTMEWDTAAGHAIVLAAGGRVDGPDGKPLRYAKAGYRNSGFAATSGWAAPRVAPYL